MIFYFVITDLSGGGAEKAIIKVARVMAERGHQVTLILLRDRRNYAPPVDLNVKVLYAENSLIRGWLGVRLASRKLKKLLADLPHPNLVVSTLPLADEIVSLLRLPNHVARVANTLGSEVDALHKTSPQKAKRRQKKYREIYSRLRLVTVSDGVAADLIRNFSVESKVEVIPNIFDIEVIRAQCTQPPSVLVDMPDEFLVHAGRFAAQKRHDVLLDAWRLRPDLPTLVLLTDPSPRLMEMISQRGLKNRVIVLGFQSNPYFFYRRARCLILCSDHEGLPNVLLEALICGTPVISTDCPSGPADILRDYPQCLVPRNNPLALATAIDRCLSCPPSVAAYDFSKYSPRRIAEKWESLAVISG